MCATYAVLSIQVCALAHQQRGYVYLTTHAGEYQRRGTELQYNTLYITSSRKKSGNIEYCKNWV